MIINSIIILLGISTLLLSLVQLGLQRRIKELERKSK